MHKVIRAAAVGLVLVLSLPAVTADAVFAGAGTGSDRRAELGVDDGFIQVQAGEVGDTFLSTDPPEIFEGGRGGGRFVYQLGETTVCAMTEQTPGWSFTMDPDALSATFTSTVPGCSGTIVWTGDGDPGFAIGPTVGFEPGLTGTTVVVETTTSRTATVTGSINDDPVDDAHRATMGYTSILELGAGPGL